MSAMPAETNVLDVKGLKTVFFTNSGLFRAVDDVSFHVKRGETLAIVGESGCGKSVSALSIMRLVPNPPGRIVGGEILLEGTDLLGLEEAKMREIRGNRISMIFQEPMTSLNPVIRIGDQISEAVRLHREMSAKAAWDQAVEMLRLVRIPEPARRAQEYPHQLSGGMRQRVMIALALACNPSVLIADEPTTALDVTVQAQILDLLRRLQAESGMSILFVTHNLGVVAEIAHRVVVMYAGRVVEDAGVNDLFDRPTHPYTQGLLSCIPTAALLASRQRLVPIPGNVPSVTALPSGCTFAPRCPLAGEECTAAVPELIAVRPAHHARCFKVSAAVNAEMSHA